MPVQVSYKKQFVFFILMLFIFIIVVEGFSRIYLMYFVNCKFLDSDGYVNLTWEKKRQMCSDYHDLIRFRVPYRHHLPNQHFETYNINNEGFRGPEIQKEKPNDVYRIFVVGGSTVYGLGTTSDDTTIPGWLQQKLNAKSFDQKIEVINAGQVNMGSWGEIKTINNKLVNYAADLIIFYGGWNDLKKSYEEMKTGPQFNLIDNLSDKLRINISYYKTPIVAYVFHSSFNSKVFGINDYEQFINSNLAEKVSIWKNRVQEVCEQGKELKYKTIVVLQPFLDPERKPLTEYEKQTGDLLKQRARSSAYELFATELDSLMNSCSYTADFRNIFMDTHEPVYYDRVHLTDRGNEIVADELVKIIRLVIEKN